MPEFSDAQVIAGINEAMKAKDFEAVVDLMHVLAAQAPKQAALLIAAFELAKLHPRDPKEGT